MIVAGTGHRPERLVAAGDVLSSLVSFLEEVRPERVISGFAEGFDTYLALAADEMGIPVTAAVPWVGHMDRYSEDKRSLLDRCFVQIICDNEVYHPSVYDRRDRWMVDNSGLLVSCWDGVENGGTWNTIKYARRVGREVRSLWR